MKNHLARKNNSAINTRTFSHRVIFFCALSVAIFFHAMILALPAAADLIKTSPQNNMLVSYAPSIGNTLEGKKQDAETIAAPDRPSGQRSLNTDATTTVTGTGSRAVSQAATRTALLNKIESIKTYPPLARSSSMEGSVRFRLLLDEYGRLASLVILQTSGFWVLDDAAEKLVRRALPFQHNYASFSCEFSITYRLSGNGGVR